MEKKAKVTPSIRAKRFKEIEDLTEVTTELKLQELSRERAQYTYCDDKARVYTQEMEPVRKKKNAYYNTSLNCSKKRTNVVPAEEEKDAECF